VEIVQGAHGLLTLSNLYGNIYVNALGLYLPGGGAPDNIDPTGTVGTPTITNLSFTIDVTGISEDNVVVELLSSSDIQLVTSGNNGTTRSYTISHSESSGGTYSYTVRLTDAMGNTTDYAVSGVVLVPPGPTPVDTITFTAGEYYTNETADRFKYDSSQSTTTDYVYNLFNSAETSNFGDIYGNTIKYNTNTGWDDYNAGPTNENPKFVTVENNVVIGKGNWGDVTDGTATLFSFTDPYM
jgi:hypothetical protein